MKILTSLECSALWQNLIAWDLIQEVMWRWHGQGLVDWMWGNEGKEVSQLRPDFWLEQLCDYRSVYWHQRNWGSQLRKNSSYSMHLVPDLCNTLAIILMHFLNISLYNQNYPTIKMNHLITRNTNEWQKHLTKPCILNIAPKWSKVCSWGVTNFTFYV